MVNDEVQSWEGRFECESKCGQLYACGVHSCESVSGCSYVLSINRLTNEHLSVQTCHPPSRLPEICPKDPSVVLTCPCGKHPITSLPSGVRTSCSAPIPTCGSTCAIPQTSCTHACLAKCHTGPCPPCSVPVNVACRCGQTMRYIPCSVRHAQLEAGEGEVMCDIKCGGMRHCGRHACSRVCCPLASVSTAMKKGKGKRTAPSLETIEAEDFEGWHNCDLVSGYVFHHFTPEADLGRSLRPAINGCRAGITCARCLIIVGAVLRVYNRRSKRFVHLKMPIRERILSSISCSLSATVGKPSSSRQYLVGQR